MSPTLLALHSLICTSVLGAYIAKRRGLGYLVSILNRFVNVAGLPFDFERKKRPIAMWPLHHIGGEQQSLRQWVGGRIDLCKSIIGSDPALSNLFGNEDLSIEGLVQFDFLTEWNSYLVLGTETKPEVAAYLKNRYPDVDFSFKPNLIAFELKYLTSLAVAMFTNIRATSKRFLAETLMDDGILTILGNDAMSVFLQCLRSLEDDHEKLMSRMNRIGFYTPWPEELSNALNGLPARRRQQQW